MFEDEKYFGNLDIMHRSVRFPDYVGTCIGVYLIGNMGKGFIAIFCDNGKHQSALAGYNPITNTVYPLSLNEIKELINKFGNESLNELRFSDKLNFSLLGDFIEDEKCHIDKQGIIRLNNTKIYYDFNSREQINILPSLFIGQQMYPVSQIIATSMEGFAGKLILPQCEIDENIRNRGLNNEAYVLIDIEGVRYVDKGIVFRYELVNGESIFNIITYPLYMLNHIIISNLTFQNIRNHFFIIKYIMESIDIDIQGVSVPTDTEISNTFLVVMAIKNLKLITEPFSIGDVRVGEEIKTNEKFENILMKQYGDSYSLIWTDQKATNHYEAFALAKEKIMRVADMIIFFSKNDCITECFGTGNVLEKWDASRFFPQLTLTDIAYIENCVDRQAVTISGNEQLEPRIRVWDEIDLNGIEQNWLEVSYIKCVNDKDKRVLSLFNAIRWLNNVWSTTYKVDKIIDCVMALEFCLYKEKGTNIIEDKLAEYEIENVELANQIIEQITSHASLNEIKDLSPELEKEIIKYINDKLRESSFNSKLACLVKRLQIPVSEEEVQLIAKFRKMRNSLIHGKGMEEATDLNVKKMAGIVSKIITYKLFDIVKGET